MRAEMRPWVLLLVALCLDLQISHSAEAEAEFEGNPSAPQSLEQGRVLVSGSAVGNQRRSPTVEADHRPSSDPSPQKRAKDPEVLLEGPHSSSEASGQQAAAKAKQMDERSSLAEQLSAITVESNSTIQQTEGTDDQMKLLSKPGKAFIPLHPVLPRLTVKDVLSLEGVIKLDSEKTRQLHINRFADVSATPNGASIFGGNMHVLKEKGDVFRYSNTNSQMGAIGFAANFPHYNKASIISSKTKASEQDQSFKPETLVTFTGTGDVGIGVTGPASRLHVHGTGNQRLINANHWLDVSGCSSGVGLVAGNSYVSTSGNKAQFRYANSHSSIGAIGLAFNYPAWNQASIIASTATRSESKQEYRPLVIQTYTHDGNVGIGTKEPASRLSVSADGRQLSVNNWIDVSSQSSSGFIGANAYMRKNQKSFSFSNSDNALGAIGLATNFPSKNVLSIIASKETRSERDAEFRPVIVATYTNKGLGIGTTAPSAQVDVRDSEGRQVSANKFVDVSANEASQGFFGGNGYTAAGKFSYSNSDDTLGAIGLATHYPEANSASIITSGSGGSTAGSSFSPTVIAQFTSDGSLKIAKDLIVEGDIRIGGRMIYDAEQPQSQYDMLSAHEALLEENSRLQERMRKMEESMMGMQETMAQ